jgi:hypothetical protein
MEKKRPLPLVGEPARPSIDAARARLGGRIPVDAAPLPGFPPGTVVRSGDARGVIVYASKDEAHVLIDAARVQRVSPGELAIDAVPSDLAALSDDARVFGTLGEGLPVRYKNDHGELVTGCVVEKCRWGALVQREDGVVVAVGFRKLWPLPTSSA